MRVPLSFSGMENIARPPSRRDASAMLTRRTSPCQGEEEGTGVHVIPTTFFVISALLFGMPAKAGISSHKQLRHETPAVAG